jgi:leucyl-tRNA synthetase
MAVPAHDERDYDFAMTYALPIRMVVCPDHSHEVCLITDKPYVGEGSLIASGKFDGMESAKARTAIATHVGGKLVSQYRLKDWVFARQRYWGEPFPIVFDSEHKPYLVADSELPVQLPEVEAYEPTDTGESPLANIREWVEVYGYLNTENEFVSCKKDDPRATHFTRETNTMPQWAGSSWYYLRYIDPKNPSALVDREMEKRWSPVDFYVGGAEHATRHLIYARFWHKFLYDIGVVAHPEPFARLQNVGLIMASDGRKMSKRYGNVINPDDIVETYGADSLRVYEMFMGPFGQAIAWSTDNLMGARRFVERMWRLQSKIVDGAVEDKETAILRHQTIKKVGADIESFAFNTAIAQLMVFLNHCEKRDGLSVETYKDLLLLVAPFAPHLTEEVWHNLGLIEGSVHVHPWPAYDEAMTVTDSVTIGVQINGKLRDTLEVKSGEDADVVKARGLARENVQKWLEGKEPKKLIYIEGKILNIVL